MLIPPSALGGLAMVGRDLIEWIEYGTISLSGISTSGTYTLTRAVDVARAVLVDLRQSNNWNGGSQPAYTSTRLALTNSTTVTASRNASGGIVCVAGLAVVQLRPNAVRSVQYITASGNGSITATLSNPVNPAKAIVMSLGLEGDSGGLDGYFYGRWGQVQSDGVSVALTRDLSGGSGMLANAVVVEGW